MSVFVRRSVIRGSGSALPARCVSNAEMATMVDTTDEWIVERTGIRARYLAGEGETTGSLATLAAQRALAAAGWDAATIDCIVPLDRQAPRCGAFSLRGQLTQSVQLHHQCECTASESEEASGWARCKAPETPGTSSSTI